jgi:hypothetical protein
MGAMVFKFKQLPEGYYNLGEAAAFNTLANGVDTVDDLAQLWRTWVTMGRVAFSFDGVTYVIPTGFMTDFSSVPRLFRWLIDPIGQPHQVAGVVHDFLYSSGAITRKRADAAFLAAAVAAGSPYWRAALMHRAIRLGGWFAWRSNRARLLAGGSRWRFVD